jgi:hypothetical protein
LDIATNFAFGEEGGAIFHDTKGKEKQQEDTSEGGSDRNSKKKKKSKQSRKDPLVGVAERKNPRAPPKGGSGVFDEMLEKLCPYHRGPVKDTLKGCGMMKRFFSGGVQGKGNLGKRPEEDKGNGKEKDNDFPVVNNCSMIFGSPVTYESRRQHKLERREVYIAKPAMPTFLNWSRSAITFDRDDYSDRIPQPG